MWGGGTLVRVFGFAFGRAISDMYIKLEWGWGMGVRKRETIWKRSSGAAGSRMGLVQTIKIKCPPV